MSTSIGKINLTGLGNGWDLLKLLLVEMVHPLERMIKHFTFLPISSEQQHYIYPVPQPPGQLDMCFQFMLSSFETHWAWVWESMVWREEKQSTLLWLSSHTTLSLLTDGYRYLSKNIYSIFGLFTCEWVWWNCLQGDLGVYIPKRCDTAQFCYWGLLPRMPMLGNATFALINCISDYRWLCDSKKNHTWSKSFSYHCN